MKFLDKIEATLTGKIKLPVEPLLVSHEEEESIAESPRPMDEHFFGVKWGRTVSCYPRDRDQILQSVMAELKADVYGELYFLIRQLERAVYSNDSHETRCAIRSIITEIYD